MERSLPFFFDPFSSVFSKIRMFTFPSTRFETATSLETRRLALSTDRT